MLQHRLDEAAVDARRHLNKRRWRLLAIVLVVIVCVAVIVAGSIAALLGRVKATAGHE
jgi:t-SNARE complex subunit (syntaxin)